MTKIQEEMAFILVASKAELLDGGIIRAEEIARRRLDAGKWGLYINTPHKAEIRPGDTLIVYLAGPGGQRFIAAAEAGVVDFKVRNYRADGDVLTNPPVAVLSLHSAKLFPISLPIARIKDRLEFVPKDNPKWGCVLQRGVKRISAQDATLILREAQLLTDEFIDQNG
ncbi:EVE domain-containing protein [Burkholderia cepacia]|uniref:hypothetical protein n=1 Tax=Burkholderia cepacia TaxID=292 RepID=UPI00158DEAED|nr:hypothetical protein [Burkholderia cepacia]MCA7897637.1 EVE domain-containing protein [Burkholderia cepacia]MCA7942209.1 EVE domain-containing protein [Burkholderia cepacia]MDN7617875.1 hypothetical protein [Burkholderia cepacia]